MTVKGRVKREGVTSVQIQPDLLQKMDLFVRQGLSKSEIINEALRQYLVERELQGIRRELLPLAQAQGIYTDEDVKRVFR